MSYFVGLDVSLDETAICIVDDAGVIFREGKAETEPEAIATWLRLAEVPIERLGLEAGPLSPWLSEGLRAAGFPGDMHRDPAHEGRDRGDGGQDRSE